MVQVKIYGLHTHLYGKQKVISDAIHTAVMEALNFPANKRAHRFFLLEPENFFYPEGRTDAYTIIEISMFEGRSITAKKRLMLLIFKNMEEQAHVLPADVEITITETPRHNWGFRGQSGDQINLNYDVEV